jgi:3-deoxy-D-manno-octulosonic-acid transferase
VLLGDTMGELMTFYAAADVAFVAGSLVPIGGHNLLEPASVGLPVLTGPHNFNSEEIAQLLVDAGAAVVVSDTAALAHAVKGLLDDPDLRAVMGAAGRAVLDANRGALDRLLTLVDPLLE